jgi:aspartyl-tRNA(Asn)/glutamyl-tRNA(Gln) amidotransferase subunit C
MIDDTLVKKLAALSRLTLTETEVESYAAEMEKIVEYVSAVSSIKSTEAAPALKNIFRKDDSPREGGKYSEKLLSQAPERQGNYVKVKKIIEQ